MCNVQDEDLSALVECMALNSASTSEEEESEASEVDSFLIEEGCASNTGSEVGGFCHHDHCSSTVQTLFVLFLIMYLFLILHLYLIIFSF